MSDDDDNDEYMNKDERYSRPYALYMIFFVSLNETR